MECPESTVVELQRFSNGIRDGATIKFEDWFRGRRNVMTLMTCHKIEEREMESYQLSWNEASN